MNNIVMMTREDLDSAIWEAARRGAEEAIRNMPKDRPEQVNYTQAGKLLRVSRQKVSNMVRAGVLRLNGCGCIPISEVDRVLSAKAA